jgi:Flp pilus assembly pilin Flp
MKKLLDFCRDTNGSAAIEYCLITLGLGLAIVAVVAAL